ncbi:hypothetical protein DFO67_12028 [Modicisalibacter xianhensis]|uniref:Transmembrane anchor protein n=1 Tax=Modicisalibacter xianhensis TaxID=442341 RepID=A0A4V3GSZ7_9GAMM|nr:hypothetical protein [Halomonas xianhensis]TDX24783.1 hypothetical protein DFO67_12028 [Halomonas xianhensis]
MGEIKEQLAEEAELDRASAKAASSSAQVLKCSSAQVPATPVSETSATSASAEVDQPATPATPVKQEDATVTQDAPTWRDEVQFTLSPGQGTEYKLTMEKGNTATFAWQPEGGPINYDTHGDGGGNSISHAQGRGVPDDEGELVATFTGNHGWFFRNRNDSDVTVVLRVGGDYGELKRML